MPRSNKLFKNRLVYLFGVSFILAFLVSSCEGDFFSVEKKIDCSGSEPYCVTDLDLELLESINISSIKIYNSNYDNYELGLARNQEDRLISIKDFANSQGYKTEHDLIAAVLFLDSKISDKRQIADENVISAVFYEVHDGVLHQNFALRELGGKFHVVEDISGVTAGVRGSSIRAYAKWHQELESEVSVLAVMASPERFQIRNGKDKVLRKIMRIRHNPLIYGASESNFSRAPDDLPPYTFCERPCPDRVDYANCEWIFEACVAASCLVEETWDNALNEPRDDTYFNQLRDFRDAVLSSSDEGSDYVDFFYYLSDAIDVTDMPLSLTVDIVAFINDIRPFINALLDSSSSSDSTVLLTTEVQMQAIAIIDQLRSLTSDQALLAIFDLLEQDMSRVVGKTKTEVLAELGL